MKDGTIYIHFLLLTLCFPLSSQAWRKGQSSEEEEELFYDLTPAAMPTSGLSYVRSYRQSPRLVGQRLAPGIAVDFNRSHFISGPIRMVTSPLHPH